MKDEVGGWLRSFQPQLLTVVAATLQSTLGRDRKPGGRGCPALGEGAPRGRGGRRPGRVQYWQGKEQHCTASRPSRPPGALESRFPTNWAAGAQGQGCSGEFGSPYRCARAWTPGRVKEVAKRKGCGEKGCSWGPGRPLSNAKAVRALAL